MKASASDEQHFLEQDQIPIRSLVARDLDAVLSIDKAITGQSRQGYLRRRVRDALEGSDVRIALVAEQDGRVVGFLLGAVYYGEFGLPEPAAVLDTIGVDSAYAGRGIGAALVEKLLANLRALGIERIQTQVDWKQFDLLRFLAGQGFEPATRICLERRI